ncbi:MAG: transglutaminase [Gallionellaceae bacterium]|nr:MAG: transglutaminase [Gallionellaceae bacterium]
MSRPTAQDAGIIGSPQLVYGLAACILLVGAPHAGHLLPWVSALCAVLLGWRAYLAYSGIALPPRWLLLAITLGGAAGILISFRTLFGREAGVTLLVLLAALKLLELRSARDATLLIYLACFILVTHFFYSQSIPTALFMLAVLPVIVATWLHLQNGALPFERRLRMAAALLLQAIPLTLVLFVLFPRVPGPLWGLPQDAYASSGLDDKMSPGSLSRLSLSDAVAFRVTFGGIPPRREQMYWRGPVLWEFDGRTWTPGKKGRARPPQLDNLGNPTDYTVTLEPHNKFWLFALEMPAQLSVPSDLTHDFQLHHKSAVNARLRYGARSHLGYRANVVEDPRQLQRALSIPGNLNSRARQLAAEWRANLSGEEAVVRAALAYFNREKFQYTLEPPLLGTNSVDDFLFETRQGFCEHYASSFVFLMRAAGVPARVVTGYQGGELNDLGGYFIIRQSDAHAWAEVWLLGRGWVRVDPTAAIAPARVQSGLAASLPGSTALPFFERNPAPWLRDLRFNLDALANRWNQWVLGYDTERQFAFLTRMGLEAATWQKMALNMLGGVALLIALAALLLLRRLYTRNTDPAQRLYLRFCRKLARGGIARAEHEGAQDFAVRASRMKPQSAEAIADITSRYLALRYGSRVESGALPAMRRAVAAFKV